MPLTPVEQQCAAARTAAPPPGALSRPPRPRRGLATSPRATLIAVEPIALPAILQGVVLFVVWLAVDVATRGAGREHQGGALLSAACLTGVLVVAWLVAQTAGKYPQGRPYDVAVATLAWLPLATAVAGIGWIVRGRWGEAVGHGQVLWGAFHVTAGVVLWPLLGYSVLRLIDYC